MFEDLYFVD